MQPASPASDFDDATPGPAAAIPPADAIGAGDAAFWGASSYRSGGVGWREFLAIDEGDDSGFAAFADAEPGTEALSTTAPPPAALELTPWRQAAWSELAASEWRPIEATDDPIAQPAFDAFGSWSESPDDLLPFR